MSCCGRKAVGTKENPSIFGHPEGEIRYFRAMVTVTGASAGGRLWARGTLVGALVDQGWLVPIEGVDPIPAPD